MIVFDYKPSHWTPRLLLSMAVLGVVVLGFGAPPTAAQQPKKEDSTERVIDKRPFDEVVLRKSVGGQTLVVQPIKFPGRRVPKPFPGGNLTVRIVSKPGKDYHIAWSSIAAVNLYEQLIMQEAEALTKKKKYNEAFDYFAFLNKNYPDMPGLEAGIARYLQADAAQAYGVKKFDQAMAILISLYERNPEAAGLGRAVDTVAEKIIRKHQQSEDWRAARQILDVVDRQFKQADLTVVKKWRRQFKLDADKHVRRGAEALKKQDYRTARQAATAATVILPEHAAAAELFRRVAARYPTVVVGVRTRAPRGVAPRIDSPASLRASRLAERTITELSSYSPEGGVYTCPVGRVALADSGVQLNFTFPPKQSDDSPFALSRYLLRLTNPSDPAYDRAMASITKQVGVEVGERGVLNVDLNRPHIRPEAILRHSPLSEAGLSLDGQGFTVQETTPQHTAYIARAAGGTVAEVRERYYDDDGKALEALATGDIDILDRLMPWQLDAVRSDRGLAVGSYRLPTVHVLIPTKRHKLLDQRSFRRAMLYAINLRKTLNELILGGRNELGCTVISGPFPTGRELSDPIHYGYNDGVMPREYDPRLGALLSALCWSQMQKAEHGQEDLANRPFPTLTLAHGSDPVARSACQAIQMQLEVTGVSIDIKELTEEELLSDSPDFDLRYAELAMWEPLVDADRLLGPKGISGRCSDPMIAALKRLDGARNWVDVSSSLHSIHELAAGDLPVIPLWQTVNFYAYRSSLQGVPKSSVSLYQTIDRWTPR